MTNLWQQLSNEISQAVEEAGKSRIPCPRCRRSRPFRFVVEREVRTIASLVQTLRNRREFWIKSPKAEEKCVQTYKS